MSDDDESPVEAAERIVDEAVHRHFDELATALEQIPKLFDGIAEMMPKLIEALEPLRKFCEDYVRFEDETIAAMEDQMPF